MTNQQILKKAIQKAIDGGYTGTMDGLGNHLKPIFADKSLGKNQIILGKVVMNIETLIFSHDFAKALWGEEKRNYEVIKDKNGKPMYIGGPGTGDFYSIINEGWQYHQHKMLDEIQAAKDPIKYLGENI